MQPVDLCSHLKALVLISSANFIPMVTPSATFGHLAVPSNSNGPLLKTDNNAWPPGPCLKAHELVNYFASRGYT